MDMKALLKQLQLLPSQERIDIAYALIDSVRSNEAAPPLSDAHLQELQARLAHHRAHPDEPGVTLEAIRRRLLDD